MQRFLIVIAIILTALITTACDSDGEIRVRNYSSTDIGIRMDYSRDEIIAPNRSYSKFFGESRMVRVAYDGVYLFGGYTDIYIETDDLQVLNLYSDGGAVQLINNSRFTIDSIYLATSTSTQWGPDDLYGNLTPGQSILWTASPGYWDLKIVNNQGAEFYFYDMYVYMDRTSSVLFVGDISRENRKLNGLEDDGSGRTSQRERNQDK